jgi:tetratricopeptide (TPR) repeat protein
MAASQTFELMLAGADAPHECVAWVPDGQGGRAAEHRFAWRSDSIALALDLGALAQAATAGHAPADDLHVRFGRSLYDAALGGAVGELWRSRRQAAGRTPLRLVLRIDPASARPLLNLPWEYLHDGRDFLALSWRTPLSRLPWGVEAAPLGALDEPLRLLVQIAAPHGLGQNEVLNSAREEDLLLEALGPARRAGRVEIEFTPNGTLEALEAGLREFNPHVLHFTGHGVFDILRDSGLLLMERAGDHGRREVPNAAFAEVLERQGRALRMVFLAACQTAVAPRGEAFADLGPRLLAAGIPAVVAMQFSVLNRSAIALGAAFYQALADNDALDDAMTEARAAMRSASPNSVDFAVPVLFLSDPACLQVNMAAGSAARPPAALGLGGLIAAQQFVGRTAELRELQTNLDPQHGSWRAAIVHGLGGMGKTALAARLAERMAARFAGISALRATPTTRAQDVLDHLAGFLAANNARLHSPAISEFVQANSQRLPLAAKADALAEVLRRHALLLIFDNFEDVLPGGRRVSRGAPAAANAEADAAEAADAGLDPDLAALIAQLVGSVAGPSRFLFTSRVDFQPVEPGRIDAAIGRIALPEMQFREAVYLMETLPPLDALPVAVPDPILPGAASAAPLPAAAAPALAAISMRDLYTRLGGHPYTLTLFARHARHSSVAAVLADLGSLNAELLQFTLLHQAAAALPARAAQLLRRAVVYEEPVPAEGLAWLLGDERDAMPAVDDELAALLGWGLLARPPGRRDYASHALVRDWARAQWADDERLALLRRAAQYWLAVGNDTRNLGDYLNARYYLFAAGDYAAADDIVQAAYEYLLRWGQVELVFRLLSASVRTLSGSRRAVALGNLATVHQALGNYATARDSYEQVLGEFQALADQRNIAAALHQLGMLHQAQGEYGAARARYQESLELAQALGDQAGVANSLHQLGRLFEEAKAYEQAVPHAAQSFMILSQLGSPNAAIARSTLLRLRSAMGQAAFDAALAAARLAALPLDTADDADAASADDGMTVAQAIELVVNNSAAVLTSAPEHQAEWLETLQQLQAGAQAQGLDEFATFCGLLRELVAGADAAGLAARVPEPMRAAWEELLGSLGGAALPGATPAA